MPSHARSAAPRQHDALIEALVSERKRRGLRQQDVADAAGISRRALVSIEAGGDCTLSTLRALCEALGVELLASPASAKAPGMRAVEELSEHQAERELAEALRVQSMSPRERTRWLDRTWGHLQRQARSMYAGVPRARAEPRYFKNLDEKNRYDEERELAFAVELALSRR